jgi:hypothetical protein
MLGMLMYINHRMHAWVGKFQDPSTTASLRRIMIVFEIKIYISGLPGKYLAVVCTPGHVVWMMIAGFYAR